MQRMNLGIFIQTNEFKFFPGQYANVSFDINMKRLGFILKTTSLNDSESTQSSFERQ